MVENFYDYPSNYSNGTLNVSGVGDFIKYASYITGDWLGIGMITILWVFIFGFSMMAGSRKALLTSSFICFLMSIYLFRMDILPGYVVIIFILGTIIGAIGSKEDRGY